MSWTRSCFIRLPKSWPGSFRSIPASSGWIRRTLTKKSNLRRLGRLGLLAQCMHRFPVNLKRQPAGLYAALEPELVDRYLGNKALGCFSQVKPSESAQKLASVCQEVFLLVERFGDHPEVNRMLSYRMLHRVLHEHCEVKPAADSVPGEVVAP